MNHQFPTRFAKKSLGQNFLIDDTVIARIVSSLEISPGEPVVEIGPGRGALTHELLDSGAQLTALEIDRELVPQLNVEYGERDNFHCIEGDVLQVDLTSVVESPPAKLVGNLPYYISTAILQKLIEQRHLFSKIVLMLQKEVVARIIAKPGDSSRGFLTVLVEDAFESVSLFDVSPSAFVPRPKVWSSVISLTPKISVITDHIEFRRLVSASFAQKRKTIFNNLRNIYPNAEPLLSFADIDPKRRAETLTLLEWASLANAIGQRR